MRKRVKYITLLVGIPAGISTVVSMFAKAPFIETTLKALLFGMLTFCGTVLFIKHFAKQLRNQRLRWWAMFELPTFYLALLAIIIATKDQRAPLVWMLVAIISMGILAASIERLRLSFQEAYQIAALLTGRTPEIKQKLHP